MAARGRPASLCPGAPARCGVHLPHGGAHAPGTRRAAWQMAHCLLVLPHRPARSCDNPAHPPLVTSPPHPRRHSGRRCVRCGRAKGRASNERPPDHCSLWGRPCGPDRALVSNGTLAMGTVGQRTGRHPLKNSEQTLPGVEGEGGWHGDGAQPSVRWTGVWRSQRYSAMSRAHVVRNQARALSPSYCFSPSFLKGIRPGHAVARARGSFTCRT
jgi:hypothetical protein